MQTRQVLLLLAVLNARHAWGPSGHQLLNGMAAASGAGRVTLALQLQQSQMGPLTSSQCGPTSPEGKSKC